MDDGVSTKSDSVTVTLQSLPTVNAGNDTSYCWWVSMFPVSGTAENYSQLKWSTDGDGHFNFDNILDPRYYPGDEDRANGYVILNLTADALEPCNDSVSDTVLIDLVCTKVTQPDLERFNVRVAPNPSSGVFYVNFSGAGDRSIDLTVLDLQGRMMYKDAFVNVSSSFTKKLELSSLSKGTYLLRIQTKNEVKTEKLMIH